MLSNDTTKSELDRYESIANKVRRKTLDIIYKTKSPHIGPSFSIVEMLVAIYFKYMKVFPGDVMNLDADKFILSKGHACATLYTVLYEKGFMSMEDLDGFAVDGGLLEHHPSRDLSRYIDVSTGSLGHGLSIGAGMALADKIDNKERKIYVVLGDGELNEGSVWEAVMFAAHHGFNNLVAIVDYNKMQALGHIKNILGLDPLGDKWKSFGWEVQEIDGHDFEQIFNAFDSLSDKKPNVVIMNTVKGKGVSFMEDQLLWHYRCPDDEEYKKAVKELTR
jgi:transketolase